ncbi:MAG: family 20 glycosylhydrolase [Odoribacter sp.]
MRFSIVCLVWLGIFVACSESNGQGTLKLQLIPVPEKVSFGEGVFLLDQGVGMEMDEGQELERCGELLNAMMLGECGYQLQSVKKRGKMIRLRVEEDAMDRVSESYRLEITPDGLDIIGGDVKGVFYGIQTLGQLLADPQFLDEKEKGWRLPVMQIVDRPAFPYRGLHLDVSRHFFPKEFVMKCIDWMAFYKLNRLHWHLTDAAGWRIEIKKFPELTRRAAWRAKEDYLGWWNGDRRYVTCDSAGAYGGYYTQDEIREVVAYATARQVTVIPEIEMPGHSEEVLAVYPELGCTGKPYRNGEFCVGNEKCFEFVEEVLTEVLALFPSEYIHVGGDEASKAAWKVCPKCQKRIKEEHLKDEAELQSYMVRRVGKWLKSKGRKLIGWDEILEGGLAPEAAVMSWRGEKGGIEAARMGHDVVMTPGAFCYFDSYQADPQTQPYAIGGFTPYLKTYSYHPVPEDLSAEEARHILGAQANVWTEYITTSEHVEYMIFPRLLALAEVVWSPEARRDREDFKRRVEKHVALLRARGVNAFKPSDRVEILTEPEESKQQMKVWFDTERYRPEIRYRLNDGEEQVYTKPFYVKDSAVVRAAVYDEGGKGGESMMRVDYHRGIGHKVAYRTRYSGAYPASKEVTLTDGFRGGLTYSDGRWQGFLTNVDVVVDMGRVCDLSYVSAGFMQLIGPGVYLPDYVAVSVSEDGKDFREVARVKNEVAVDKKELVIKDFTMSFQGRGRYVRLFAKKHSGFQFVDEIVIY